MIIAFLNTLEILLIGFLVFKVTVAGSLALLLLLTGLFLVTVLGIGLLISTVASTQQEAMLTTMITLLPSIFLSGFFFPLAAMPAWLQLISYLIPLRYYLIIARGIVVKGVGVAALWPEDSGAVHLRRRRHERRHHPFPQAPGLEGTHYATQGIIPVVLLVALVGGGYYYYNQTTANANQLIISGTVEATEVRLGFAYRWPRDRGACEGRRSRAQAIRCWWRSAPPGRGKEMIALTHRRRGAGALLRAG